MRMVRVPLTIKVHGIATMQPDILAMALAVLPTSFDMRVVVGHALKLADATGAQGIAHCAHTLSELTSTVWTSTLLRTVDVPVLIMVRILMWMKIDLHSCDNSPISFFAVLGEVQQHFCTAVHPVVL